MGNKRCEECAPVIHLTALPNDLYDYILDAQVDFRKKKKRYPSLDFIVYKIIREHRQLRDQGIFLLNSANEPKEKDSGSNPGESGKHFEESTEPKSEG